MEILEVTMIKIDLKTALGLAMLIPTLIVMVVGIISIYVDIIKSAFEKDDD